MVASVYIKEDFGYYLENDIGIAASSAEVYLYQVNKFISQGLLVTNTTKLLDNIRDFVSSGNKFTTQFAIRHLLVYLGLQDVWDLYYKTYGKKLKQRDRKITNKAISLYDIKKVLELIPSEYRLFFSIQYETGCRVSELLRITRDDVRMDDDGNLDISILCKGNQRRITTLSTTLLVAALIKRLSKTKPGEKIFHFSYDVLYKHIRIASIAALGYPISSHWLRHSRGCDAYAKTHDPIAVKELLGHKRLDTTYNYLRSAGLITKDVLLKTKVDWEK